MKARAGNPLIPLLSGLLILGLAGPFGFSFQGDPGEPVPVDLYGDPLPAGARARLGTVRFRHSGGNHVHGVSVTCLAYSPDGMRVASGGGDGTVRLWEVRTGKQLRRLEGHKGPISAVAFSPDGSLVASAGGDRMVATRRGVEGDKTVRLWDAASGREIRTLRGHDRRVTSVAFSPDGRTLASGSLDGTVRLWTTASGQPLPSVDGYQCGVYSLAFTPDGKAVATMDGSHHLRIVVLPSGGDRSTLLERVNIPLKGRVGPWPNGDVSCFALSPDGKTAVTVDGLGFGSRSLQLWDLASAKELPVRFEASPERPSVLHEAIFSPDGKTLAVRGGAGSLSLWDAATGRKLHDLRGHLYDVSAVAFSPDGKLLASGCDDRTIRLWETSTGKEALKRDAHEAWVDGIEFSPDGKTVVTAAGDSTVAFWDPLTGRSTDILKQPCDRNWTSQLKFSPDSRFVAVTGTDGNIHLWDAVRRRYRSAVRAAAAEHGGGQLVAIAVSPDGRRIAVSADVLRILDVATGKEERRFAGPAAAASSMAFTPDGGLLWTTGMLEVGSKQSVLQAWDLQTGRNLASMPIPDSFSRALAVSPDGSLIATVAAGAPIRIWEVATAREVMSCAGPVGGSRAVAFSPDGKTLATGGEDSVVRLWSLEDGSTLAAFEGHAEGVSSLAFSPDGATLASASGDTTALLWRVPSRRAAPVPAALGSDERERLWSDLGEVTDPVAGYRAVLRLWSAGDSAAAFLRERISRPSLTSDRLRELLEGLDDAEATVRDRSTAELLKSGDERMLRAIPLESLSAEAQGRLRSVLGEFENPLSKSAVIVRTMRSVRVLEFLGTKEARGLLKDIARSDLSSRAAREARASLGRLGEKE